MSEDYLWDGSGTPDPEIERLERALGPLRHAGRPPQLPETAAPARSPFLRPMAGLAAAAAVAFAMAGLVVDPSGRGAGWDVASLQGQPRVAGAVVGDRGRLGLGEWLETDARSRARIAVGAIGEVELGPRTRVRLVDAGRSSHRLSLLRGQMLARIKARPGQFLVDTPSATAVDLGCVYTLEVDDAGAGLLTVRVGWVAFAFEGRESFVPAGARCPTRREAGPGTPYFIDAPPALRAALERLDFGAEADRAEALEGALAAARPKDAVSLWHLLRRVGETDRGRVYDALAGFVPPPAGVTRDGIVRGDRRMLDQWWDALGLGDVSWWRGWERPWAASQRLTPSPR